MLRKALVLGSEGNIGAPLVRHLRANGWQVLEADIRPAWRDQFVMADINHPVDLLPAFDWQPSVVFLLSAMVSRVTCEQASSLAIATNLSGVNNVLQLCKRTRSKVVFFSTSEVYGPECDPMDESISNPKPNNRYGLSKLLGEQLVEYEARTYGLEAVVLRPFMVYDENEDLGDHRSAMIRFCSELAVGRSDRGASRQRPELAAHQRCGPRDYSGCRHSRVHRHQHRPSGRGADRAAGRAGPARARRVDGSREDARPAGAHDGRQAAVAQPHAHAARRHADGVARSGHSAGVPARQGAGGGR